MNRGTLREGAPNGAPDPQPGTDAHERELRRLACRFALMLSPVYRSRTLAAFRRDALALLAAEPARRN